MEGRSRAHRRGFVRGELLGEPSERERGDADRGTNDELYLHRLERAACVGTDVCTVTMSDITMATATFDVPAPLTLTVVRAGTGSGTVTITQGDIACEITCSASYDNGTVVTLTASARYGVFLQRLERRGRSGRGSCTVVVSAATTVTATFNFRRNRGHRGLDGSRSNCEGSRFDDVVCTLNLQVFFAQKRAVKMDHL